jgi:RNA polymerase sigma-70 factor, ECF subfamily
MGLDARRLHPFYFGARYLIEDVNLSPFRGSVMNALAQTNFVHGFRFLKTKPEGDFIFFIKPVNVDADNDRDIELLRQIAGGDRAAFAEFYDRHCVLMFSVASKILNNASDAEDVLQEAFVQIWEKSRNFDPKLGKPSSWVAILVRNRAIDRIRALQRRTRLTEAAGVEISMNAEADDTVNAAIYGRDKSKLIQSAIAGLPLEQRRAIELAYFSGLTQDEISKKLQEPLGTIKARIRRGLLKLRDQLEGVL